MTNRAGCAATETPKDPFDELSRCGSFSVVTCDEDPMSIDIRPFTIAAYDDVLALWQQCDGIGLREGDSRESIQVYLDRNPGMSFVATDEGSVVGAVLCGHDGRRGYIHHLAVHPEQRRRALGRRLVEQCVHALRREGIQRCHLFVLDQNQDGIEFWTAAGWAPRGDIRMFTRNIELHSSD